jgi:hypothetical protein
MNHLSSLAHRSQDGRISPLRWLTALALAAAISAQVYGSVSRSLARLDRDAAYVQQRDAMLHAMTLKSAELPCLAAAGCGR